MRSAMTRPAKPLLRVLAGECLDPPPFWLMRQAGRYLPEYRALRAKAGSFLDLCYTPEFAVEVTLQPLRRFGMNAAILFSDILVVPDGLGQKVAFKEGEGPVLEPLRSRADLARLTTESMGKLAPVYETVRRLTVAIPEQTSLIGFAGAPWTVATYMIEGGSSRDFLATKSLAYADDPMFVGLMELLVEATFLHLSAQIQAGAEVVQLFDSWSGVLPEPFFHRWVINPTRRIVERLKAAHPTVPIIGFPRGAAMMIPRFAEETGVDAVSLDQTVPMAWAAREIPAGIVLQGNLDPACLVIGGSVLERSIDDILTQAKGRPLIFNLGHGIVPQTPPDHVAQLAACLRGSE